jgi:DNA replication protein DnaC
MDAELQAAQDRLMEKRRKLGITETVSPIRSMMSSQSEAILSLIPKKCPVHDQDFPCLVCEQEAREREEQDRKEREARERERFAHPEYILGNFGVGKRYQAYSFDNFNGGEKIKTVLQNFVKQPFDVVLMGGPGCGKTHLAVATLREVVKAGKIRDTQSGAQFITAPELLMEIRRTYNSKEGKDESEIVSRYAGYNLLILDDIGAEQVTDWAVTMLYLIIDKRYRNMAPTIITTNLSLQEAEERLSMRIASRMSDMRVVNIKLPDHRKAR